MVTCKNTFIILSPFYSFIDALSLNILKIWWEMPFTEAQELFSLFFAIYFALIIDRSHEMYKPWDTYSAWKGKSHNIKRLLAAWIILFIVPLFHFSILFVLLGLINVRFDMTISDILNITLIGLGSFFEYGYFRIYEALLHRYSNLFSRMKKGYKKNVSFVRIFGLILYLELYM